jgi:hypothetical protein
MWPTTQAFNTALLAGSRLWRSKVEVLYSGSVVTSLDVVTTGEVDIDDVAVRRSLRMSMVDVDGTLTPADAKDLLAPKGTEVRVYKGLVLSDGSTEWVPLGTFGVEEPEVQAHQPGTRINLTGYDRVDAIRLRRFDAPWSVASGTPTSQAIGDIVTSRLSCPTRLATTGNTTTEVVFDELSDPWDAVRAIAEADSMIAYFDPLGTLVVEPDVETETGVVYQGGEGSLLLDCERTIRSDTTYSGVIVKSSHPDIAPIRVVLWDTDPNSPTYYLGPFGKRPYGFASPLITDSGMATTAATTILARVSRMKQSITVNTIGNPGHDIGDVITVIDPRSRTNGRYTIYGGKIPLRLGPVWLKARTSIT